MFREYLIETYGITDKQLTEIERGIEIGYTLERMMFLYLPTIIKYNRQLKKELTVYIQECIPN